MSSTPSSPWALLLLAVTVTAPPPIPTLVRRASGSTDRCDPSIRRCGESLLSRGLFTVISLLCMTILGGLVGYRVRQLDRKSLRRLCFSHVLVFLLYVLSICFVFSAAVVKSGLGLSSVGICRGAIYLCIGFYFASKVIMYLFLVERTRALRAPFKSRLRDRTWIIGTTFVLGGSGCLSVLAFAYHIADLSPVDGRCRIGIPRRVTISIVAYDIAINILLTATFAYLLSPLIRSGTLSAKAFPATRLAECFSAIWERQKGDAGILPADRGNQHVVEKLEKLLWKTFLGSVLVMIPTIANLAAITAFNGRELGWVCLTTCTFDVVWTVFVIHWLTVGASGTEERQANK
ncbi:hypothetical protein SVAN01_11842 [Stagonosporopsis vannaccii]|nr:hypothetical protein SVAN01_11842 [Stagonosporopsis vannaccii]